MSKRFDDDCDDFWERYDSLRDDDAPSGPTESVICSDCNGSGEGMFDGSRCSTCGGSGEVEVDVGELVGQDEGELPAKAPDSGLRLRIH